MTGELTQDFGGILQMLRQEIGLDHGTIGEKSIEVGVQLRMQRLQIDSFDEYLIRLLHDTAERQELIEEVVVPETWFFRGFDQFRYLTDVANRWKPIFSHMPLRILSIPCSTGEEPYSIYMWLRHVGLQPHQIRVTAVDVSHRAIERARRGTYSELSFREREPLSDVLRQQFFEGPQGMQLVAEVRAAVHFRQGNLLTPGPLADDGPFDVIFCRNALIYFDWDARRAATGLLDRLLVPHGHLFGGHAESTAFLNSRWSSVGPPGAFCYQKQAAGQSASPITPPQVSTASKLPTPKANGGSKPSARTVGPQSTFPRLNSVTNPAAVSASSRTPLLSHPIQQVDLLISAEEAANAGHLEEARLLCERALVERGPTAQGLHLLGVILQAVGEFAQAEKSFHKAIYLDPAHAEALWHLTILAERRGDQQAAETFRRRLARISATENRE